MTPLDDEDFGAELPPVDMYVRRLANQDGARRWRLGQRGKAAVKALRRNGFDAFYVESANQARDEALQRIPAGATVGVGGSVTIRHLGIPSALEKDGHVLFDHWKDGLSQEEILRVRRAQLTCDVFLSSANALTLDGQLVSTDGIGNRIAAMIFGPKQVLLVLGANKVVANVDEAILRLRDVCAPLALRDSGFDTPCVRNGICGHCNNDKRLCRATVILECPSLQTPTTVIVVGEELGF